MSKRRFERIALATSLAPGCAIVFCACVLIEHAQAQPGYVPPSPPPPPPVLNPSSPNTAPQPPYTPVTPTTPSTAPSTPSAIPSVRSPTSEEAPSTTARSEQGASVAKTRSIHHHHHHRVRPIGVGPTLGSFYCPYGWCVRVSPPNAYYRPYGWYRY
jgi:hypothetical protein